MPKTKKKSKPALPPTPTRTRAMNDREVSHVLAALRFWQGALISAGIRDIATNGGEHEPMTVDEIDELCENLNLGKVY